MSQSPPTESSGTCADLLIRYLELEGVSHVFGIPGSANAHTLYALGRNDRPTDEQSIRYVICRQETGAAYIADGYARASGELAALLITAGPGATNALTGVVNAHTSRTPMLVMSGEVAQQYYGRAFLQEGVDADLDIDGVYRNACAYSAVVSAPTNFAELLTQALRQARSRPGAATHLSLPDNIMASPVPDGTTVPSSPSSYRVQPNGADRATMEAIVAGLLSESHPLVFLGNGARRALRDDARRIRFVNAIDRFAIPVMTDPDGKGLFPESHPLSLRNFGLAQCEWPRYYLEPNLLDPDRPARFGALLVIGSELGELATLSPASDPKAVHYTGEIIPTGMFAHIDENQSIIGRNYSITNGLVADIGHSIDQFVEVVSGMIPDDSVEPRRAFVAAIKNRVSPYRSPEARTDPNAPIKPQALMTAMQTALDARPEAAHIWVDAGNCVGWCMQYLTVDGPTEIHSALTMGPMGFAVGAVIGGKLADPSRTSVAVVGDGAFLMQGSEISTAAANGVGAVWVVLNDRVLNMVAQGMAGFFPGQGDWEHLYDLGEPDLSVYARSLGADSYDVYTPAEAASTFEAAFRLAGETGKPQVIVAHIDVAEIPPYYAPVEA